jgi:hypothetical protein
MTPRRLLGPAVTMLRRLLGSPSRRRVVFSVYRHDAASSSGSTVMTPRRLLGPTVTTLHRLLGSAVTTLRRLLGSPSRRRVVFWVYRHDAASSSWACRHDAASSSRFTVTTLRRLLGLPS